MKTFFRSKSRSSFRFTFMLMAALSILPSRAAFDAFIALYDASGVVIKGESLDKGFPGSQGWFAIKDFSLGVQNPITIGSAGAGAGKTTFADFTIRKNVDTVSPTLFRTLATGTHFKYAKLVLRKSGATGGESASYLIYQFNTIFVAFQNWSGGEGDDAPAESITLRYGAMQVNYRPQNPDGTLDTAITAAWNQISNTSQFDPVPGSP